MRRPVGVVLSCIVLGFAAFLLLMMAANAILPLAMAGQTAIHHRNSGFVRAVLISLIVIYITFAAWAIATLVGLLRTKKWACYSVMVIGGKFVLIGLGGVTTTLFIQALAASLPLPDQNPAIIHIAMAVIGVVSLGIVSIGIWWLVYFARRSTRALFTLGAKNPQADYEPSPYATSAYEAAGEITVPVPQPIIYPIQGSYQAAPPKRPLAVSIFGWLFLIGTVFTLPYVFLPFPIFLFGMVLSGTTAHLTMFCLALISGLTGIGLLRLEKIALYLACIFQLLGLLNTGLLLVPAYRDRLTTYTNALTQGIFGEFPLPPGFDNHTMGLMMLPGLVFGIILSVVALVFLLRSRAAFNRTPQTAAA
jgi:hypothetical protein